LDFIEGQVRALAMTLEGRRILYISYNGMLDALGQSQVLPYLRELARQGVRFTLLSFERPAAFDEQGRRKCAELSQKLAAFGIEWHWLRYHRRPSLPATIYDVVAGIRCAQNLVRRNSIEMVHARSHVAAAIGLALKKYFGVKLIFDLRGLMAEEYVDAGHWSTDGVPYRLTKRMERRVLQAADGVVTLTEKIWPIVRSWEGLRDHEVIHEVVPCCVDLELFKFSEEDRQQRREELDLKDQRVLVYSGSIGGWYLTFEMANLFAHMLQRRPDWHFLWLTTGDARLVDRLMSECGLSAEHYTVRKAAPADVPSYLSAADAGVAFYKPALSRLATSPVKVSEYLASGLPFIINAGVGDSDELVMGEAAGALVSEFSEADFEDAASIIDSLVDKGAETRKRNREVAERLFDVRRIGLQRYAALYEKVLGPRK